MTRGCFIAVVATALIGVVAAGYAQETGEGEAAGPETPAIEAIAGEELDVSSIEEILPFVAFMGVRVAHEFTI